MNITYADLATAPAIFITKPISIDVDVSLNGYRWIVIGNNGTATINAGTTFTNNGVIQVRTNALLHNNGIIIGSGQIQGAFTNNSILAPGNSPGTFSITGNYTATANAIHQIEIASLASYDQIKIGGDWTTVGGNAIISGALNVSLLNGYTPALGNTYKIFTYASGAGNFTSSNLPALPAGLGWHIQYNPNDITLEIINCIPQIFYADADGDGFGDPNTTTAICSSTPPTGYVSNSSDCDDTRATYADRDGDGFGAGSKTPCGIADNTDCNDNDASVHAPIIYYKDADNDGFGNLNITTMICSSTAPLGYVSNSTDCNDGDATIHPGATEICDGIDNNCDGNIDEGFPLITYYLDADGDTYGTPSNTTTARCGVPAGYVARAGDCNDAYAAINPGAVEVCGNGFDDNCNGLVDENCGVCKNAIAFTTTNITASSAKLNWNAIANPVQWQVQYKTINQGSKWVDVLLTGDKRSVTISSLLANQNHHWHIRAKCGNTWTEYSDAISFKTLAASTNIVSRHTFAKAVFISPVTESKPSKINLYPNPSKGQFVLEMNLAKNINGLTRIEIVNSVGQTIYTMNGNIANGILQKIITIPSSIINGIYLVKITADNKIYQKRLIYAK